MDKWVIRPSSSKDDNSSTQSSDVSSKRDTSTGGPLTTPKSKRRKFDASYIKYGFSSTTVAGEERGKCVICSLVLANDSLKPRNLIRHLQSKHPECKDKSVDFFQRRASESRKQADLITTHVGHGLNDKLLKASYEVSLLIAKTKKAHMIGESLIVPAAYKICQIVHGEKHAAPIKSLPLSNDTVSRRICDMSSNVKTQLLSRVSASEMFAIQLDETTDVTNCSQLIVFVRYIHTEEVLEDYLFSTPLSTTTKGQDVFKAVNEFFVESGMDWSKCRGVCTDGAAAMVGYKIGFIAEVKKVAPHARHTHCMLHREHLASQSADGELKAVLKDIVDTVNFVKSKALNSRLFRVLCQEMGSDHDALLYHTEVRWLSRGKVLMRVMELRQELQIFLEEKKFKLADKFLDEKWVLLAHYLADIFGRMNDLYTSMQGKNTNIITLCQKVKAFNNKMALWLRRIENGDTEMFASLHEFMTENETSLTPELVKIITDHILNLQSGFDKYFSDLKTSAEFDWVSTPFDADKDTSHIPLAAVEELIEIRTDVALERELKLKGVNNFWCGRCREFPLISKHALYVLIPFASTYLCEAAFSTLLLLKNKHRSRLSQPALEANLRLSLSNIHPQIEVLCAGVQAHPSH